MIIVPLLVSILQAETCQILRLAENPRWSVAITCQVVSQNIQFLSDTLEHRGGHIGFSSYGSLSISNAILAIKQKFFRVQLGKTLALTILLLGLYPA